MPRRSLEVAFDGTEFRPTEDKRSGWRVLDEVAIHPTNPVRLLDENGVPPRRFDDPLLPPGDWTVQVRVRRPQTAMPDELYRGREHDQMVCVWAADALTREEDDARWGADEFDSPDDDTRGDFDGGDFASSG